MGIDFVQIGDFYLPAIRLSDQTCLFAQHNPAPLGRCARLRRAYLKEHRPILYSRLLMSEKLYSHLREIDKVAAHRLAAISDRTQAEELIRELIYD